jgi:hypothetical protein
MMPTLVKSGRLAIDDKGHAILCKQITNIERAFHPLLRTTNIAKK